jgi:hypothetical protein
MGMRARRDGEESETSLMPVATWCLSHPVSAEPANIIVATHIKDVEHQSLVSMIIYGSRCAWLRHYTLPRMSPMARGC